MTSIILSKIQSRWAKLKKDYEQYKNKLERDSFKSLEDFLKKDETIIDFKSSFGEFNSRQISKKYEAKQELQEELKKLLEDCIDSGKNIKDSVERSELQWTAQDVGDAISRVTEEYPSITIKPYKKPESEKIIAGLPKEDWGNAPEIDYDTFYDRSAELETIRKWILNDGSRIVTLVGMGGMGKTTLAKKLAEEIANQFDFIIWRKIYPSNFSKTLKDIIRNSNRMEHWS